MERSALVKNIAEHFRRNIGVDHRTGFDHVAEGIELLHDHQSARPRLGKRVNRFYDLVDYVFSRRLIDAAVPSDRAAAHIFEASAEFRLKKYDERDETDRQRVPEDPVECIKIQKIRKEIDAEEEKYPADELLSPVFCDEGDHFVRYERDYQDIDHVRDPKAGHQICDELSHVLPLPHFIVSFYQKKPYISIAVWDTDKSRPAAGMTEIKKSRTSTGLFL